MNFITDAVGSWKHIILISLTVTSIFVFYNLGQMPFHADESFFITEGIQAFGLVEKGRLFDSWWSTRSLWYLISPPLPKIVIGFVLDLAGISSGRWDYFTPTGAPDQVPPYNVLLIARVPSAILACGTLVTLFLLGKRLERGVGVLSVLLIGFDTLWLLSARRAMADIYAVFFSVIAMLLLVIALENADDRFCVLSGIMLGLAATSKYNAIWMLPVELVVLVLYRRRHGSRVNRIFITIVSCLLLVSSFGLSAYASNPFLYRNPLNGAIQLFRYLKGGFAFVGVPTTKTNFFASTVGVLTATIIPGLPVSMGGPPHTSTYTTIPLSILFLLGLWRSISNLRKRAGRGNVMLAAPLVWYGVTLIGLILTDEALFISRYYLPLLPPTCIIAAYGLSSLWTLMSRKLTIIMWSLIVLAHSLVVLAFYPEFYEGSWSGTADFAGRANLGSFQLSVTRPLGILSAALSIGTFAFILCFWLHKRHDRRIVIEKDGTQSLDHFNREYVGLAL